MQGEFEAGNYHRAFKHFILSRTSSKREEEEKGCERESVLFLQLRLDCRYCSFASDSIAVTFVIGLGDRKDTFSGDTAVRKLVRDR